MAWPPWPSPWAHVPSTSAACLGEDQILKALAGQRPVLHPALHGFLRGARDAAAWRQSHAAVVVMGKPSRWGGGGMVHPVVGNG